MEVGHLLFLNNATSQAFISSSARLTVGIVVGMVFANRGEGGNKQAMWHPEC